MINSDDDFVLPKPKLTCSTVGKLAAREKLLVIHDKKYTDNNNFVKKKVEEKKQEFSSSSSSSLNDISSFSSQDASSSSPCSSFLLSLDKMTQESFEKETSKKRIKMKKSVNGNRSGKQSYKNQKKLFTLGNRYNDDSNEDLQMALALSKSLVDIPSRTICSRRQKKNSINPDASNVLPTVEAKFIILEELRSLIYSRKCLLDPMSSSPNNLNNLTISPSSIPREMKDSSYWSLASQVWEQS